MSLFTWISITFNSSPCLQRVGHYIIWDNDQVVARTHRHSGRLQRSRNRAHRTQNSSYTLPPAGLVHRCVPRISRRGEPR